MTVRIGLLGSGFLSTFYMQGLQNVAGWEIPVIASPSIEHARAFARKDIDLILIAAPNFAHKDLVIRCARAGKHVVCTKPLARNRHEALEMLDAVQAAGGLHGYGETEVLRPA